MSKFVAYGELSQWLRDYANTLRVNERWVGGPAMLDKAAAALDTVAGQIRFNEADPSTPSSIATPVEQIELLIGKYGFFKMQKRDEEAVETFQKIKQALRSTPSATVTLACNCDLREGLHAPSCPEYARDAGIEPATFRNAIIEECAKACDGLQGHSAGYVADLLDREDRACAQAIRRLLSTTSDGTAKGAA